MFHSTKPAFLLRREIRSRSVEEAGKTLEYPKGETVDLAADIAYWRAKTGDNNERAYWSRSGSTDLRSDRLPPWSQAKVNWA